MIITVLVAIPLAVGGTVTNTLDVVAQQRYVNAREKPVANPETLLAQPTTPPPPPSSSGNGGGG